MGAGAGGLRVPAKAGRGREAPRGVLVVRSGPVWIPLAASCSGTWGLSEAVKGIGCKGKEFGF